MLARQCGFRILMLKIKMQRLLIRLLSLNRIHFSQETAFFRARIFFVWQRLNFSVCLRRLYWLHAVNIVTSEKQI